MCYFEHKKYAFNLAIDRALTMQFDLNNQTSV